MLLLISFSVGISFSEGISFSVVISFSVKGPASLLFTRTYPFLLMSNSKRLLKLIYFLSVPFYIYVDFFKVKPSDVTVLFP
jgi:hypothetical protein